MINYKSTSTRQQCKWISSLFEVVSRLNWFIKWYSQVVSRSIYKWYLTSGTHEDSKCSRNNFIDKSNKWFHTRKIFQVMSHFYTWYQSYKTVVPQVILNFKWSSMIKVPSSTRAQVYQMDDPCYDIGGGVPPIGIKVKDPICGISRTIQVVSFQHIW